MRDRHVGLVAAFCAALAVLRAAAAGADVPNLPSPTLPPSSLPSPALPPQTLGPPRGEANADLAGLTLRIEEGMKACRAERLAADRTRCYDALAASVGSLQEAFGARTRSVGNWRIEVAPGGTVSAGLPAVTVESDDEAWAHTRAALFVRCRDGAEADFYLVLGTRISRDGEPVDVAVRYGGAEAAAEPWQPSVAGTALGLWGRERALPAIRQALPAGDLALRLALPNGRTLWTAFDLRDIGPALAPVRAACGNAW